MNEQKKKSIGKFLSLILRHQPDTIGLILDENGWANIDELIEKCKKENVLFTFDELVEIVETNDKKRYAFNYEQTKIRTNQGHSIDVDVELKSVKPTVFLYHGTAKKNLDSILEIGIEKRSRQHVHLSIDKNTAIKVGLRHGRPIILKINSGIMHDDGNIFYLSENNVWLTDFINPKYISIDE